MFKRILYHIRWRHAFGRTKRLLAYRATSRCLIPLLQGSGTLTGGNK